MEWIVKMLEGNHHCRTHNWKDENGVGGKKVFFFLWLKCRRENNFKGEKISIVGVFFN